MKKQSHRADIAASPDEILDFLVDDAFAERLEESLEKVSNIEVAEHQQRDGHLRRVLRFTAPTRLPGLLSRFKDRAPERVQWDEISTVDRDNHRIDIEIIPDVPDHWHQYYDNRGELTVSRLDSGQSRLQQSMEFSLDAPTGFGMFLNRALKSQLEDVFETKARILDRQFDNS